MGKLQELIAVFCPEGVPRVPISELGSLTRGKRFVHADAVNDGIPCIHYGELYTYYGIATHDTKSFVRYELLDKLRYAHKNDVIIVGAGENDTDIGIAVAYLGEKAVAVHDACYILSHNCDPKYISYCLRTDDYHNQIKKYVSSGKICAISAEGIGKAKIPMPPIEVQREVVRILDSFTELTTDLKLELKKELMARKTQYAYYRDMALEKLCLDESIMVSFGDIVDYIRGITYGKGDEVDESNDERIPVLRANNITLGQNTLNFDDVKYVSSSVRVKEEQYLHKNDILICAGSGSKDHVGKVAFISEDMNIAFGGFMAVARPKNNISMLARYLFYNLCSQRFRDHLGFTLDSSTINNLNSRIISSFKFPLPNIDTQRSFIEKMDELYNVSTELTAKIPEEIKNRQQQYEYYRDRLLSFAGN